jgi:hypothetical protein
MEIFATKIISLICYPTTPENLQDVVFDIVWQRTITEGQYNSGIYCTTTLPAPDDQAFVPYDQITEQLALSWIDENTDPAKIADFDRQLQEWLDVTKVPTIVVPALPWAPQIPNQD